MQARPTLSLDTKRAVAEAFDSMLIRDGMALLAWEDEAACRLELDRRLGEFMNQLKAIDVGSYRDDMLTLANSVCAELRALPVRKASVPVAC